jgi:hypothetical protein
VDTDIDGAKRINYGGMYPEWSTDWSLGGPIIEREFICVSAPMHPSTAPWFAISDSTGCKSSGPTPLIAAMRCYVASKLGEEVDVPVELTTEEV